MTLDEFLDRVPWVEMATLPPELDSDESIRHKRTGACPICAVWGGDNDDAPSVAITHGLDCKAMQDVIVAADGGGMPDLRAEMERRIAAAREVLR